MDTSRFHRVKDLFSPTAQDGARFSLWHGATLRPDGSAAFKIYLNPQITGPDRALDRVARAFGRLGMRQALDGILERLPRR